METPYNEFLSLLPEKDHELVEPWRPAIALTILDEDNNIFVVQRSDQSAEHPGVLSTPTMYIEPDLYNLLLSRHEVQLLSKVGEVKNVNQLPELVVSRVTRPVDQGGWEIRDVELDKALKSTVGRAFSYKFGLSPSEVIILLAFSNVRMATVTTGMVLHPGNEGEPGPTASISGNFYRAEYNQMLNIGVKLGGTAKWLLYPRNSEKYNTDAKSYGWYNIDLYKQAVRYREPGLMGYQGTVGEFCLTGMCNRTSSTSLSLL
jgi:hypothetical protein